VVLRYIRITLRDTIHAAARAGVQKIRMFAMGSKAWTDKNVAGCCVAKVTKAFSSTDRQQCTNPSSYTAIGRDVDGMLIA